MGTPVWDLQAPSLAVGVKTAVQNQELWILKDLDYWEGRLMAARARQGELGAVLNDTLGMIRWPAGNNVRRLKARAERFRRLIRKTEFRIRYILGMVERLKNPSRYDRLLQRRYRV